MFKFFKRDNGALRVDTRGGCCRRCAPMGRHPKRALIPGFIFGIFSRRDKDLGYRGENLAVKFLRRNRYKILEKNFRLRSGEIDIIARDGNQLVFVEVKTRSSNNQEFLRTSVNRGKEKRLAKTASYYLSKQKYQNLIGRFDVIFIINDNGKPKIEHIKNAFSCSALN